MSRRVRIFFITGVFIAVSLFQPTGVCSQASRSARKVLVLNSYHPSFPWTESIVDGIVSRFEEKEPEAEITLEYLDTKNYKSEEVFPLFEALFQKKYATSLFDVIISTDNNALDFLFHYRPVLFPGIPIVFCAINNYEPGMLAEQKAVTGVVEDYDIKGTVDAALRLHPATGYIAVISDITPTDAINRSRFDQLKPDYLNRTDGKGIQFIDLIGLPAPELQNALRELPADTVVVFFNYYRDTEGTVYTLQEGISLVKESCACPVYSMWEDKIEAGVLGGVVTSGELQGKNAADMALEIIHGGPAEEIPVLTESPRVPMFNHNMLKKFGIKRSVLPKDSIILQQPDTFFYKYTNIIWEAMLIFTVLVTIIIFLRLNIGRRKRAEEELRNALREKDYLLQELNHRVKNNLAIISSLIGLKNSALQNTVDLSDIKSQIDAIQIVHEILYKSNEVRTIEIHNYFQKLLDTIFSSFSSVPVEIINNAERQKLPTKTAISLGLIINELATNAIKYGFTGSEKARFTVELSTVTQAGEYLLSVSNSGNPFPEGIDLDNPETLGLRLVSALTAQVEGTIELRREPRPVFTIRFPDSTE